MGFNLGSNKSKSESSSSSSSSSSNWQEIWSNQIPYLEGLYKTGSEEIGRLLGESQNSPYEQPAFESWRSMLGGGGSNPALQESIRSAQQRAAEGFNENILPGLTDSAIGGGNLGGSRGQIAAGIAGREAMRQQSDIATQMQYQDYEAQQQRAMQALGMTGGLQSLSMQSLQPLLALAQIIGRPTTLGFGEAESESKSTGSQSGGGWSFGLGMGQGAKGGGY